MQDIVQLLRPVNLVIIAAATVLGGLLTAGAGALQGGNALDLCLAALSAVLIAGAGNSINDYFDVEVDRVNRPDRPLPSGRLPARAAVALWASCSVAGAGLSLAFSAVHVGVAISAVALLYAYSRFWKRSLLVGNLVVSVLIAAVLVYGGAATGASPVAAGVGAVFAFLTTLAREMIKDIQDAAGDMAVQANTLAIRYGPNRAAGVASLVLALTMLATPIPYLLLGYGGLYLLIVGLADGLMLRALWLLQTPAPALTAEGASRLVKGAMVVGISALAVAAV